MFAISSQGISSSMLTRLISVFLVSALIFSSLPTMTFASDTQAGVSASAASLYSEESTTTPTVSAPDTPAPPATEEDVPTDADETGNNAPVETTAEAPLQDEEEEEEAEEINELGLTVGARYLMNLTITSSANNGTVSGPMNPMFNDQAVVQVTNTGNIVTFYHDSTRMQAGVLATPANIMGYHYSVSQQQGAASGAGLMPNNMNPAIREVLNATEDVRAISVNWPDAELPQLIHIERVAGHMGNPQGAPMNLFFTLDIDSAVQVTNNSQLPHPDFGLVEIDPPICGNPCTPYCDICRPDPPVCGNPCTPYCDICRPTPPPVCANPCTPYCDVCRPTGTFQMGRTYLVDVRALATSLDGPSILAGMYYPRAVVEVTPQGNFVSFFHSRSPVINAERATPTAVYGYAFDRTQSTTRPAASAMVDAIRDELNANSTVRCITVRWPDLNRPLFVTIDHVPGMPQEILPAPTFMSLNPSTARVMTNHPFPEFGPTDPQSTEPGPVDRAALQRLVNRASNVQRANYTELSFAALATELRNARRVLADRNATQRTVNDAYRSLRQAFDGLVRRPAGERVDPDNMTDGRYTVRVDFWHATNNAPSMANDALNKTAIIDVSNGNKTMSLSTRQIRVGQTVTALGTLQVNGRNANVIARNLPGNRPSAFSFNLPNTNSFHPVVFWLNPRIEQTPRPDLPGRLRISWDTLRRADGTALSTNIATVDANIADPDEVERTAELAEGEAPEPVLAATAPIGAAAEIAALAAEAAAANQGRTGRIPWFVGTLAGGLLAGIIVATWIYFKRRYDGKVENKIAGS